MKLQQLRYVWEVAQRGLNISATAEALYTSQPGVSKQIRLLEDELGVQIFARSGKHLTHVTPAGQAIVELAGHILNEAGNVKRVAQEFRNDRRGTFSFATTHTQARYWLPTRVRDFMQQYPEVQLCMHQGTPATIAEMMLKGEAELAVATEGLDKIDELVTLPLYRWNRCVLVPKGHVLTQQPLTLETLAAEKIATYGTGLTGRPAFDRAFAARRLHPRIVFTAADAEVIKTYTRMGLGVAVVTRLAYDAQRDGDLVSIDAGHLFEPGTTRAALRRHSYLRRFVLDFLALLGPHLTRDRVEAAVNASSNDAAAMFDGSELPEF